MQSMRILQLYIEVQGGIVSTVGLLHCFRSLQHEADFF